MIAAPARPMLSGIALHPSINRCGTASLLPTRMMLGIGAGRRRHDGFSLLRHYLIGHPAATARALVTALDVASTWPRRNGGKSGTQRCGSGTVPACFRWTIGALFGRSKREEPADSAEFSAHGRPALRRIFFWRQLDRRHTPVAGKRGSAVRA